MLLIGEIKGKTELTTKKWTWKLGRYTLVSRRSTQHQNSFGSNTDTCLASLSERSRDFLAYLGP